MKLPKLGADETASRRSAPSKEEHHETPPECVLDPEGRNKAGKKLGHAAADTLFSSGLGNSRKAIMKSFSLFPKQLQSCRFVIFILLHVKK